MELAVGTKEAKEEVGHVNQEGEFDPTAGSVLQKFENCSIGRAPSGFPKIHVEMRLGDLVKMIGYDPRTIRTEPRRGEADPGHVSQEVIEMIRQVQRSLEPAKVEEMVGYLHAALSNDKFADWAELDVVTAAKPDTTKWLTHHEVYFPTSTEYFITDGQHRYCALMDFGKQYPELAGKFTQAVAISVLPQDRLSEWAGQSFHDKNYLRTTVKMTKALAVDRRDPHNVLTKELHQHPVIKSGGGVNEIKDALATTAKEFATHSALYRFTRGFCEGPRGLRKEAIKNPNLTGETFDVHRARLFEYVDELNRALPNWTVVPGREDYLFRSSPAMQALGVIGYLLYMKVDDPTERKAMITKIGERKLDWKRSNVTDWNSVIGIKVENEKGSFISPRASRQSIDGTIKFLKDRSGLTAYLDQLGDDGNEELEEEALVVE
jgi:hypothetical protein